MVPTHLRRCRVCRGGGCSAPCPSPSSDEAEEPPPSLSSASSWAPISVPFVACQGRARVSGQEACRAPSVGRAGTRARLPPAPCRALPPAPVPHALPHLRGPARWHRVRAGAASPTLPRPGSHSTRYSQVTTCHFHLVHRSPAPKSHLADSARPDWQPQRTSARPTASPCLSLRIESWGGPERSGRCRHNLCPQGPT